jgi:hypothetical protein
MELVTAALMVWAFAYAVENAKSQWRHTRDGHARTITSQHPMWHPRKVRRHATWRALGWWAHEAKDAFPTIRRAWTEDREHVRYLREQERIGSEARIGQWRAALAEIRAQRAAHTAAVQRGETTASFGEWYRHSTTRLGQQAAHGADTRPGNPAQPADPRPGTTSVVGMPQRRSAARAAGAANAPVRAAGQAAGSVPSAQQDGRTGQAATAHQPAGRQHGGGKTAGLDGRHTPTSSGQSAGEPHNTPLDGGNGMGIPNGELAGDSPYRAALTAMDGYDQVAQQHEQAAETLEAQLVLHGFDRDPGLMEHIRALREVASQIRAHTSGARQVLVDHHAAGDEYHTSGVDAEASAFRH